MFVNARPIPIRLLPHTVQYLQYTKGDGITTESGFLDAVTLSNVRVQYLSNIKRNNNSEEKLYEAKLFFDVVNSKASGLFEFTEDSKVIHNGMTMTVKKVNPVEAFKLHHYEIGLV